MPHHTYSAAGLVIALAWAIAWPAMADPPAVAGLLGKLERRVSGALEQVAVLRESADASGPVNPAASAAGISDGGFAVTLASLERTSLGIDDAVTRLRSLYATTDPRRAEILLLMRVELTSMRWSLEELSAGHSSTAQPDTIDRIQRNLIEIDTATAAMGTLE